MWGKCVLPENAKRVGNGDGPAVKVQYLCNAVIWLGPAIVFIVSLFTWWNYDTDYFPPAIVGAISFCIIVDMNLFLAFRRIPVEVAVDGDKCVYFLLNGHRNTSDDSKSQWTKLNTVSGTEAKSSCIYGQQLYLNLNRPSWYSPAYYCFTPLGKTIEECITFFELS